MQSVNLIFLVVLAVVSAIICYRMAAKRNRDPQLWAILGFFGGILAIVSLALLGKQQWRE